LCLKKEGEFSAWLAALFFCSGSEYSAKELMEGSLDAGERESVNKITLDQLMKSTDAISKTLKQAKKKMKDEKMQEDKMKEVHNIVYPFFPRECDAV
jgi:hypothetical protein